MKIIDVRAVRLNIPPAPSRSTPRRKSWSETDEVANPMSRFPHVKARRSLWLPKTWDRVWCKVTLEDGTWGLGATSHGRPVAAVIDDHLAPNLVGQDGLAHERLSDMMFRLTKPYGSTGLASYAISAVDLALWDAKGRLLGQPVYKLIGGAHKDRMFCYVTGNDVDWFQELGFTAFKLACPYGPADGAAGLDKNEAFVARVRQQVGDACEIMLDCWMAFDVEYTVRLAERLRPYRLKWMEECLIPEDFDAHIELRQRLPWQTLATGEHWYTHVPFQAALRHGVVDILQPDIEWVGGLTTCLKIAHLADAAGKSVILHGGGLTPFGQHFSYAMPAVPWLEYYIGTPPGVPLEEGALLPGVPRPREGWLVPSDAPGFGWDIPESALTPFWA
jgi:L-rhamnonate dehydratase